MKKLIMLLAASTIGVAVQGASVKWTCTNVKQDGTPVSGIAYFVNAATLSQDSLSSLNSASDFTTALSGMYSWTPTTAGNYGATVANSSLGLSDATTGNSAYLLIFDTATITDESNYFTTTVKEFATLAGTETASVAWAGQASRISSVGWSSVSSVPEPTSGILLLVGIAGLALRRKRA